jgi:1,4-dihydroxy-2-naphthoyl-CoA hydrolase
LIESNPLTFSLPIVVRFGEVDAAGVVYFVRIFDYAHRAFEALLTHVGFPIEDLFQAQRWGMPLVHAEADFVRPMRLGEVLEVQVTVAELGEKRISFAFVIRDEAGLQRATVRCDHAFVDLKTFRGRSAPPEFVAAVERLGFVGER